MDQSWSISKAKRWIRSGFMFGVTIFACMLVWSQLVPLGAGPDEPSNFIKAAALIRGQFIGEDVDKWQINVDGWAFDSSTGIRRVILTIDGQISAEGVPIKARKDVAEFLGIDVKTLVGFSIGTGLPNNNPRSYAVYAELNDGTIVILDAVDGNNVVKRPVSDTLVDGRLPQDSISTNGYVDQSWVTANLNLSYWSTKVNIDPQFGVALSVPGCFAPYAEKPGCNTPIEDLAVVYNPPWTGMGRYPPAGFAASGIGTLVGPNDLAFRLARGSNAVFSAFLIALAFACLRRRMLSVLPLLVALSPGVLFISGVINPSGIEICAALALWASLPSFISSTEEHRLEALTVAFSGTLLMAARPLGVLFYVIVFGVVVLASGMARQTVRHVRKHYVVYGLHAAVAMFMVWWFLIVFNSAIDPQMTAGLPKISIAAQLLHAIGDIPRVIDESIGNYGWLDTATPRPIALAFLVMTVSLVVAGWRSLTRSAKRAIGLLGAACAVLIIVEDLNYYDILRGFGVQGRHITPLLVGIPIIGARYLRISARGKWIAVSIWCGVFVGSGLAALRRYSVGIIGDNALDMFSKPEWTPPMGIYWSIILLIATSALVGLVVMKSESDL